MYQQGCLLQLKALLCRLCGRAGEVGHMSLCCSLSCLIQLEAPSTALDLALTPNSSPVPKGGFDQHMQHLLGEKAK